jgi:hypothetical protein
MLRGIFGPRGGTNRRRDNFIVKILIVVIRNLEPFKVLHFIQRALELPRISLQPVLF